MCQAEGTQPRGSAVGEALRRMRKARALSQEAIAEKASLTADYVGSSSERENVRPWTVILNSCYALGCTPADLLADFTVVAIRGYSGGSRDDDEEVRTDGHCITPECHHAKRVLIAATAAAHAENALARVPVS